jgi:hypothetical protein
MKNIHWVLLAVAVTILSFAPAVSGQQQDQSPVMVGRIAYLEGQVLRYVPEEKDWVAAVQDAPFGLDDSLYAVENAKAELIMPNNTWVRIGGSTQLQLIKLDSDASELDEASGIARFYNKSARGVIKATTPFGYVIAPAQTIFDLYVGAASVEVISLRGTVTFVHDAGNAKYEVIAGGASLLADSARVTSGTGAGSADWSSWNEARDAVWRNRLAEKGNSAKYLPAGLDSEAYALEENGTWDQVYYEGAYRNFWRPRYVYDGWAPYTVGRWTNWYGDPCWIPYEPFGYVTHHYGCWVYVDSRRCWYWAPPVARVPYRTGPYIAYGWYPGRVSWIYSTGYVGWVPLAPWETYYCHRRWGPHSVVIVNGRYPHVDHHRHRHINHAVVVRQDELYTVNTYNRVRIKGIDRDAIISRYKGMPVLDDRAAGHSGEKYQFTSGQVTRKPRENALERITFNQGRFRQAERETGASMLRDISSRSKARPEPGITVKHPEAISRLAPAPDTGRKPIRFDQGDLPKAEPSPPVISLPKQPGETERLREPRRAPPGYQTQPIHTRGPEKPVQTERPRAPHSPGRVSTGMPEQPERLRPQPPARVAPREATAPTVRHTNPEPIRRLPQGPAVHEPGQKTGIEMPEPPHRNQGEHPVSRPAPERTEPRSVPQREQYTRNPQQPERYAPPAAPAQRTQPSHR